MFGLSFQFLTRRFVGIPLILCYIRVCFPYHGGENFLANLTGFNIGMPPLVIFYYLYGNTSLSNSFAYTGRERLGATLHSVQQALLPNCQLTRVEYSQTGCRFSWYHGLDEQPSKWLFFKGNEIKAQAFVGFFLNKHKHPCLERDEDNIISTI